MKGEQLQTKHFGIYTEMKESTIPAIELTGKVRVNSLNGLAAAFLYTPSTTTPVRYDLPQFMQKFENQSVALIARPYTKQVGEKTYHKLVVIAAKPIGEVRYAG